MYWCDRCQNIYTQNQAQKISCKESEEESPVYDLNGDAYYHHNIIFPEEVPYLANLMIQDRESTEVISSTQPINAENFVKFIREKYRLCWKEIYLKFSALNFKAEKCKTCRKWFQISQMAGCDGLFHEIDINEEEIQNMNQFSRGHFEVYKQQFQVTDNLYDSPISEILMK